MAGGLLSLVASGSDNVLIYGNPTKSFFQKVYSRITNFGMQRIRVDFEGKTEISLDKESEFVFNVPRHGDLLGDTYVCIELPDIWSSFAKLPNNTYRPYEFRWIDNIGAHLIKEIEIIAGGSILSKYSGEYLMFLNERDEGTHKKELWNRMTGNIEELSNPAKYYTGTYEQYPHSVFQSSDITIAPSIRGRTLYIPLDAWFCRKASMAYPLICTQYVDLSIRVRMRPVRDLYRIKDVTNDPDLYVRPDITNELHMPYRFLGPPIEETNQTRTSTRSNWNTNIHLIGTYYFLSNDERTAFAERNNEYLIKDPYEQHIHSIAGTRSLSLESKGLVSCMMFRLRRNDAYLRNEWDNYTNQEYRDIILSKILKRKRMNIGDKVVHYFITPEDTPDLRRRILNKAALVIDGKYRENDMEAGLYDGIERYARTRGGGSRDDFYIYNFALDNSRDVYQPSGGMNMTVFQNINLEVNTITPPLRENVNVTLNCDPDTGAVISTRKNEDVFTYNFDMIYIEERYNVVKFNSGLVGLMYAR